MHCRHRTVPGILKQRLLIPPCKFRPKLRYFSQNISNQNIKQNQMDAACSTRDFRLPLRLKFNNLAASRDVGIQFRVTSVENLSAAANARSEMSRHANFYIPAT